MAISWGGRGAAISMIGRMASITLRRRASVALRGRTAVSLRRTAVSLRRTVALGRRRDRRTVAEAGLATGMVLRAVMALSRESRHGQR